MTHAPDRTYGLCTSSRIGAQDTDLPFAARFPRLPAPAEEPLGLPRPHLHPNFGEDW